ncbi:30S ribosomal protein S17 [PVC group bacterium (ex Bugula neritina AB1)]|nr:30S ribosomal protein S17 [PVC group bacterium (ex Bugula neritina AB1)]
MKESHRKERLGVVIGDKMDKTIVVKSTRRKRHPVYGKVINQSRHFYVHDDQNQARVGDKVKILETRPLSKLKRWRLIEIFDKSVGSETK